MLKHKAILIKELQILKIYSYNYLIKLKFLLLRSQHND